jgi:CheY-like chemotaxis protein
VSVLIFDDDPTCAELISQVLREQGIETEKFFDGGQALELIRRRKPEAVVLDIMMPGMDGLSICRAIKSDPATAGIRVVIASGKGFSADQEQAKKCGADAFIPKPFRIGAIKEFFAVQSVGSGGGGAVPDARPPVMSVEVWGCRGPGSPHLPTACVSIDLGGRRVFLDAGSGLPSALMNPRPGPKDGWLLLSKLREDHVSGLGALAKLGPEWTLRVVGPSDTEVALGDALRTAFGAEKPQAKIQPYASGETRFQLWPDVSASTLLTRHPGATVAYRIEHQGRSVVYCPDNELESSEGIQTDFSEKFARFIRGADLLIHDARYADGDYVAAAGQGHGCPAMILEIAGREGVRRLVLYHMDARYSDADLARSLAAARSRIKGEFGSLAIDLAASGQVLRV